MNCLDSSFIIDYLDAGRSTHDEAVTWMEAHRDEPMFVPTFVLYEVLRGVARALGPTAVEEAAADLTWLEPVPLTGSAAIEAARIDGELHAAGEQVNAADRVIAGIVRTVGGTVITLDRDFGRIRGLSVEFYA